MPESKEPKRAGISWSPPGELHANQHEVLFWSLLLVRNAERVGDLEHEVDARCEHEGLAVCVGRDAQLVAQVRSAQKQRL